MSSCFAIVILDEKELSLLANSLNSLNPLYQANLRIKKGFGKFIASYGLNGIIVRYNLN